LESAPQCHPLRLAVDFWLELADNWLPALGPDKRTHPESHHQSDGHFP